MCYPERKCLHVLLIKYWWGSHITHVCLCIYVGVHSTSHPPLQVDSKSSSKCLEKGDLPWSAVTAEKRDLEMRVSLLASQLIDCVKSAATQYPVQL